MTDKSLTPGINSNYPYTNPTGSDFPILAWGPLPEAFRAPGDKFNGNADYSTERVHFILNTLLDAGFNGVFYNKYVDFVSGYHDKNFYEYVISQPQYEGVKFVMGFDKNDQTRVKNSIDYFSENQNKNIGAFAVDDEPAPEQWGFPYSRFCENYAAILKNNPDIPTSFTLAVTVPSGENNVTGYFRSYDNFLVFLQSAFMPSYWLYDFYPSSLEATVSIKSLEDAIESGSIKNSLSTNEYGTTGNMKNFFLFLEKFSKISAISGRPFWAYCMCTEHYILNDEGGLSRYFPTPTLGILRFEAFNALAMGAQGIVYYRYALGGDKYLTAPLGYREFKFESNDPNKPVITKSTYFETTEVYNYIKEVNSQIRKYQHVFLGCSLVAYSHYGMSFANQPLNQKIGCVESLVATQNYPTDDAKYDSYKSKGVLATHIRNRNDNYIVIVNHNAFYSQNLVVKIASGYTVESVQPKTATATTDSVGSENKSSISISGSTVTASIDKGNMLILKFYQSK